MKQGHLALVFLVIYISCFIFLKVTQVQYDQALQEKQRVEQALIEAVQNAGREYTAVLNASEEDKKEAFETAFMEAFYVSMGLFETEEKQEYLRMYLPMLVLAEEDGAFFWYMQERQNGDAVELCHLWSEKIVYGDSEYDDTEEVKKRMVAETLEKEASKIISSHNYIASQYGISYSFFVPTFLQDGATTINFPMLFVVFQGWPLSAAGDVIYENCIDVGLYLQTVDYYVVTGPESLLEAICIYHQKECASLDESRGDSEKGYVTEEDAIRKYGAYPCSQCIP